MAGRRELAGRGAVGGVGGFAISGGGKISKERKGGEKSRKSGGGEIERGARDRGEILRFLEEEKYLRRERVARNRENLEGGRLRGEREIEARFCDFWRRKNI